MLNMLSNRGSAAVISIIFMMFLLIIGIGFMPLMSSEVKHASMDMDEQKAWYAAEAGIKYVKACQTDAASITAILGKSINLSNDSNTAAYKLTMKNKADNTPVTSDPESDKTYIINSEGTYNGVKKTITGDFVFSTSSSGGESGGSGTTISEGVMNAGGKVELASGGSVSGNIYATEIDTGGVNFSGNSSKQDGSYASKLLTKIPDSWFAKNYGQLKKEYSYLSLKQYSKTIPAGGKYYVEDSNQSSVEIIGGSGSVLYVYTDAAMKIIQKLVGPSGDTAPFTVIYDSAIDRGGLGVEGNVRIIARSYVKVTSWGFSGRVMVVSNGNIDLSNMNVDKGFLSSNGNITIQSGSFTGQMQARGDIKVTNFGAITFDNTVLKAFGLPEGMTAN